MPGQGSGCAAHGCQLQGSKPQPGRAGAAGDGWASPGDPCAQGLGGKLALHMEKLGKCSLSMFFFFCDSFITDPGLAGVCLQKNSQQLCFTSAMQKL